MKRLTIAQASVLRFVARVIDETGEAPTVREICTQFGYQSTTAARCHLLALERRACVTRRLYYPRGIALTDTARAFIERTKGEAA